MALWCVQFLIGHAEAFIWLCNTNYCYYVLLFWVAREVLSFVGISCVYYPFMTGVVQSRSIKMNKRPAIVKKHTQQEKNKGTTADSYVHFLALKGI